MKHQIQSLLAKLQLASQTEEKTCRYERATLPVAVRYAGSLQECLPQQEYESISINILTDLRIGPPPMTSEAY